MPAAAVVGGPAATETRSVRHTRKVATRSLLALLVAWPSITWAQAPLATRPRTVTASLGVAASSTNRNGLACAVAYHRVVTPRVATGASLLFHALDHASAVYGPTPCCPEGDTVSQHPGAGLVSLLLDVELYPDAARVGPYASLGAGGSYYHDPPDAGARVLPAVSLGAGFDMPVSVARLRIEVRYLLLGSGANAVHLGSTMLGLVLPGCLTRACS